MASDRSRGSGARVLVVDDEASLRRMLGTLLRRSGYDVTEAENVTAARGRIAQSEPFDAVVTDLLMPDGSGLDVLDAASDRAVDTQVIVITAYTTTARAVEAMRGGAYDFLEKPFKNDVLLATLEKALEKRHIVRENELLRAQARGTGTGIVGVSAKVVALRELIERAASAPTSVLITGESGTGKELVARALHDRSDRRESPFVVVNCGALPENLMESELFGHEKGAFTGATAQKEGLFRAAHGGTLFLDELGELPLSLQVKLLRVLQDRRVRPVGSESEHDVDVRVVAATNRDLEAEVDEGSFREDLFYRLNVIRIALPPLRERPEDVRPLADHLLRKHLALQGRALRFSDEALRWLSHRSFPGNVRELENLVERAVALSRGPDITVEDLGGQPSRPPSMFPASAVDVSEGIDLDAHLASIEKQILLDALEAAGGNRTKAAELCGMSFRSFRYRLQKYDLGD